ncbi:sugar phosphate nucleotidyltransferase [Paenibacillus thermotolerans]|uniref:sugar phosphate nucleotidyltransferase n=1 Tax=Paenibacillus thermotolerans TaxID=3027807 RepID=UPI00236868D1|nr:MULTISPECIES: sugar phosphate nucleotidyltransferase [unclassified Paenibacillus]
MHIILLSGGSGKRLWPLSNGVRTKVFLRLLEGPDGHAESMIERVFRQLDAAGLLTSAVVVSHHSQTEMTRNHIGDRIPIISEPFRRGTFPAVSLAAVYLHSITNANSDDIVCFLPADLFVDPNFFETIKQLPAILNHSGADLAIIGTTPLHPSSQFGYIVPKKSGYRNFYRAVSQFIEKPDEQNARRLIKNQALWNCGVYAFRLDFLLSALTKRNLPLRYADFILQMKQMPELSFDREIAEHTRNMVVAPYDGFWYDLGSWEALTTKIGSNVIGKGTVSEHSNNSHLINELSIPIHVIGGKNLIVAAGPDGILVANKGISHLIKDVLHHKENNPQIMYEEKRWGSKQVLDHLVAGEMETRTVKIKIAAGMQTSYHYHIERNEAIIVLDGLGEVVKDGTTSPVMVGDVLEIPHGCKHAIKAITALTCIQIQNGRRVKDDDHFQVF